MLLGTAAGSHDARSDPDSLREGEITNPKKLAFELPPLQRNATVGRPPSKV